MLAAFQGCGVRGFWVESDFISDSTTDIQLDHFYITLLNWSITLLKVVIPVEMLQFLLKLLLKQRFLAVYYDFHRFNSPFMLESEILERLKSGVGNLGSPSRIFYLRLRNPAAFYLNPDAVSANLKIMQHLLAPCLHCG